VTDDGCIGSRRTCESTTVADLALDVADDGTFRTLAYGKDIADGERGLLAAVNEGSGVKTLGSDESFLAKSVTIWVAEDDTGKRCPTARVVNDFLDDTTYVSISLCEVESAKFGRCLVVVSVRLEDSVRAPLCPDNPTHVLYFVLKMSCWR